MRLLALEILRRHLRVSFGRLGVKTSELSRLIIVNKTRDRRGASASSRLCARFAFGAPQRILAGEPRALCYVSSPTRPG